MNELRPKRTAGKGGSRVIVISVVRLRRDLVPWLTRFIFVIALIYLLSAAFQWFTSTSNSNAPQPIAPALFAAERFGEGSAPTGAKYGINRRTGNLAKDEEKQVV